MWQLNGWFQSSFRGFFSFSRNSGDSFDLANDGYQRLEWIPACRMLARGFDAFRRCTYGFARRTRPTFRFQSSSLQMNPFNALSVCVYVWLCMLASHNGENHIQFWTIPFHLRDFEQAQSRQKQTKSTKKKSRLTFNPRWLNDIRSKFSLRQKGEKLIFDLLSNRTYIPQCIEWKWCEILIKIEIVLR